jgi:endonuclease/exonuclease/phosphatase family metal-dependent hydrolase
MAMLMPRKEARSPLTLLLAYGFLSVAIQALLATNVTLASTTFRIITYNVQFLPEPVSSQNKRPQPEYRAGRIAEEVSPFDLVALQEVFHDRHRSILIGQLRTAWHNKLHALVSPTPKGFYTSGGCLLMTRLPMRDMSSRVFTDYSRPQDYGFRADGFAAKGVLHARIAPCQEEPDNTIDVYVTHLEARADHLRPKQYAQIADFLRKTNDPTHPFLLLGDLNTKGQPEYQQDSQSQYAQLFKQLRAARPASRVNDVWPLLHGNALGDTTEQEPGRIGKRIDYIIVGNPQPTYPQLTPVAIEVKTFPDPRVVALSDHNAVTATFQWSAKTTAAAIDQASQCKPVP